MDFTIKKDITKWLVKPYPFPSTLKKRWIITFSIGIFVFLFLVLLKPFNINSDGDLLYASLAYSFIVSVVLFINLILFPIFFKLFFKPSNWNIYKMLLLVVEIIMMIAMFIALFIYYEHSDCEIIDCKIKKEIPFWYIIKNSFLVGVFPTFFYVYITENILAKRSEIAASVIQNIETSETVLKKISSFIVIRGDNKNEQVEIDVNDLIYISSEKNYASIFYYKENKIKEFLLRTSLNSIENQMADFNYIIRCHKSYIVNTSKVIDIQGNARSYQLKISDIELIIPVSRSFPKELLFTLIKH